MKLTGEIGSCASPFSVLVSHSVTSRSGAAYGSGRSTTASTTVKTVVAAPVPRPSTSTVTSAKRRMLAELADGEVDGAQHVEYQRV